MLNGGPGVSKGYDTRTMSRQTRRIYPVLGAIGIFFAVAVLMFVPYDGFQELWFKHIVVRIGEAGAPACVTRGSYMFGNALVFLVPLALALYVYDRLRRRGVRDGHTRCGRCGYILKGLSEPRCPECGTRF